MQGQQALQADSNPTNLRIPMDSHQELAEKYPAAALWATRKNTPINNYLPFIEELDLSYQQVVDGNQTSITSKNIRAVLEWQDIPHPKSIEYIKLALKDMAKEAKPISMTQAKNAYSEEIQYCPFYIALKNPYGKSKPPTRLFFPSVIEKFLAGADPYSQTQTENNISQWALQRVLLLFKTKGKRLVLFAKDEIELSKLSNFVENHLNPETAPLMLESQELSDVVEKLLRKSQVHSIYLVGDKIVYDQNRETVVRHLKQIDLKSLEQLPCLPDKLNEVLPKKLVRKTQGIIDKKQRDFEALVAKKTAFFEKQVHRFYQESRETLLACKNPIDYQFFVGPTNSGKSHAALQEINKLLKKNPGAKIAYLTPLRLLAIEVFEKIKEMGHDCHLKTGEEVILGGEGCQVTAATVELFDPGHHDLLIIDEYQMYKDPTRGQAWVRAFLNARTDRVLVLGSDDSMDDLRGLYYTLEELMPWANMSIRYFERKSELDCLKKDVSLEGLKAGDCLIAFSKKDVLLYAQLLSQMGHQVSVLYGDLPIETRRLQAHEFLTGKSHILVATDVIGMGLNLPIKRILFTSCSKFDGYCIRSLTLGEFKQIAGRAGRGSQKGYFGRLDTSNIHYDKETNSLGLGAAPYEDPDLYFLAGWIDVTFSSKRPLSQDPLITDSIETQTAVLKSRVASNLPLPINRELLLDYAKAFALDLAEAVKDYKDYFQVLKKQGQFKELKHFTINDRLEGSLLAVLAEQLGVYDKGLKGRLATINQRLGSQLDLHDWLRLCNPIGDFKDASGNITSWGGFYKKLLKCLLMDDQQTARQFLLGQSGGLLKLADFSLDGQSSQESDQEFLLNNYESLAQQERQLVFLSWINKYLGLIEPGLLVKARYNFAIYLFQAIKISFAMNSLLESEPVASLIKERNNLRDELKKLKKKGKGESNAEKTRMRNRLSQIGHDLDAIKIKWRQNLVKDLLENGKLDGLLVS